MSFIRYGYLLFSDKWNSTFFKLHFQCIAINCLKKSVSQLFVDSHGCTNYIISFVVIVVFILV